MTTGSSIGEMLLREGLISNSQLDSALDEQRKTDQPLVRILVDKGAIDETKRLNFFRKQMGVPVVSLQSVKIDPILFTYIPAVLARKHQMVPVKLDKDGLVVAMVDPSDVVLLDHLKEIVGLRIKPVVALSTEIREAMLGYPEEKAPAAKVVLANDFDLATRFLRRAGFMAIASGGVLLAIMCLIVLHDPTRRWYNEFTSSGINSTFNGFLYFFLIWGVWTIIMYEINGLVFDDLQWRDVEEMGESRSRGKALMLAMFLGWLGLDRFYLGYRRMGFVKLFSLGLFGFWWIVDVLLLMGRRIPDAGGRPLS